MASESSDTLSILEYQQHQQTPFQQQQQPPFQQQQQPPFQQQQQPPFQQQQQPPFQQQQQTPFQQQQQTPFQQQQQLLIQEYQQPSFQLRQQSISIPLQQQQPISTLRQPRRTLGLFQQHQQEQPVLQHQQQPQHQIRQSTNIQMQPTPFSPQQHQYRSSTALSLGSEAESIIGRKRLRINRVARLQKLIDAAEHNCMMNFVARRELAPERGCKTNHPGCFRCFEAGHFAGACLTKIRQGGTGTCFHCLLPGKMEDVDFHQKVPFGMCQKTRKDILAPFVCAMYRVRKQDLESFAVRTFATVIEVAEWMVEPPCNHNNINFPNNAMELFYSFADDIIQ
ncbi:hypothetical protein INT45_000729 [Circinella minor]|uniref:Uncharacterized protein n=1 Tax=Circinella minor TaxID=1195481 RepID=A0A8H7VCE8_9FUNG|nr:hypothetical protein INT45_000729 [Circinella minor]